MATFQSVINQPALMKVPKLHPAIVETLVTILPQVWEMCRAGARLCPTEPMGVNHICVVKVDPYSPDFGVLYEFVSIFCSLFLMQC